MTQLSEILDLDLLQANIENGFVRSQVHPYDPYIIYNYTEKAQYEGMWNAVTILCRGLIVNYDTGEVVARPFAKFFNYEQREAYFDSKLDEPVFAYDKIDGSLGILYRETDGTPSVATRGSFTSDQAWHATQLLRRQYPNYTWDENWTPLVEIVYPDNRIVCNYGDVDEIFLLGAVQKSTGAFMSPNIVNNGEMLETRCIVPDGTFAEVLAQPSRDGREGLVVHFRNSGEMVKIKQEDYVALHRIIFGLSRRTIWEYMAVEVCAEFMQKPQHWGSKLGIDPERAAYLVKQGHDWLPNLLKKVPEEFQEWIKDTVLEIMEEVITLLIEIENEAFSLDARFSERAEMVKYLKAEHPEHWGAILRKYDGHNIMCYLWRAAYPKGDKLWRTQSEDVA